MWIQHISCFIKHKELGNDPQLTDSLILEFSLTQIVLVILFGILFGRKKEEFYMSLRNLFMFLRILIILQINFNSDLEILASVTGNFDHWNIDYVKLDKYQRFCRYFKFK